jgi:hypothetical protein
MNVKFITSIPFDTCKSQFLVKLQDKNVLPQVQQLNRFVHDYGPNIVKLIVNDQHCSLRKLEEDIVSASQQAQQYLYLAINKFLVYSTVDTDTVSDNYDLRLVNYCQNIIANEFTLLDYSIRPDDNGTLGNFLYPVTTMFFKRND